MQCAEGTEEDGTEWAPELVLRGEKQPRGSHRRYNGFCTGIVNKIRVREVAAGLPALKEEGITTIFIWLLPSLFSYQASLTLGFLFLCHVAGILGLLMRMGAT